MFKILKTSSKYALFYLCELLFNSQDFIKLEHDSLKSLLKQDGIAMTEIEIWKKVVAWGIANADGLADDVNSWAKEDFQKLQTALEDVLPLICYVSISSTDFYHHVLPYKKVFPKDLFKEILQFQLDSKYDPAKGNLQYSRNEKCIAAKSCLLNHKHVNWIIRHIKQVNGMLTQGSDDISLNLLYRGTRDGFAAATFHQLCDNKGPTITVARARDMAQLLGGYSPLDWKCEEVNCGVYNSFIFSLGDDELNGAIFSPVKDKTCAIYHGVNWGPCFGKGSAFSAGSNGSLQYGFCNASSESYHLPVHSDGDFAIDEVEIFDVATKYNYI